MRNTFTSLFRAEWRKIVSNRLSTGLLVLVFPVGAIAIIALTVLVELLSVDFRQALTLEPPQWYDYTLNAWQLPNSEIGRLIMLAFTAIVFAGEYQWGTWKNLLTRRRRISLILMKFFTIAVFVVLSLVSMSIIAGLGAVLIDTLAGIPIQTLDKQALAEFVKSYAVQALIALTVTIIAAEYTALSAIITRSVLGSTIAGVVITLGETASLFVLLLLSGLFKNPQIIRLYQATPEYNLANVTSWVTKQAGYELGVAQYHFSAFAPGSSLMILAVWAVGLLAVTLYVFRRQDITS